MPLRWKAALPANASVVSLNFSKCFSFKLSKKWTDYSQLLPLFSPTFYFLFVHYYIYIYGIVQYNYFVILHDPLKNTSVKCNYYY